MNMKVLVFTSLYPNNVWPNHGVFIKERMTHFARLPGCGVTVVAPVPYYPPVKFGRRRLFSQVMRKEVKDGIEVYHPRYIMTPGVGMVFYGFLMFLSVLPMVKRIYREQGFDLIDAHYVYPDGFAAAMLGRALGIPVVISARGSDINLYRDMRVIRWFLSYALNRARRVIAVCQALKDAMVDLRIAEDKIAVISNGVDTAKFLPIPRKDARRELGLPMEKKIVLSVGGLIPRKGFHLLIKAMHLLTRKDERGNLLLVIAGEGPYRKQLEDLASSLNVKESVVFTGSIAHQELYRWYNAADVFCLASSREGWPNVIMESLACGTPVVATSVWGTPEIITSDEVGFLVEQNEHDIAGKITLALSKAWQRDVITNHAREHSWNSVAQRVMSVFEAASY